MCVYKYIYGEMYVDMYTYLHNCILTWDNNIFTFGSIQKLTQLMQQIYVINYYWNSGTGATVMNKTKAFQNTNSKTENEVAITHETLSEKTTFIFQQGMWRDSHPINGRKLAPGRPACLCSEIQIPSANIVSPREVFSFKGLRIYRYFYPFGAISVE